MNTTPPYTICVCPDSYLLKVRLNTLLAAHPPATGTWEKYTFWGDEPIPPAFWEHLTLQGLFATNKALIIRNAQNIPAESLRQLSTAIIPSAPTVWPILCFETGFERGKPKLAAHIQKLPCYELAIKNKLLDTTMGLDSSTLPVFIREECQRLGIAITKQQEIFLAQILPLDALTASGELAKLALLTDANGNIPQSSFAVLEHAGEITIFELLQSLQTGKNSLSVWQHIQADTLDGDNSVFGFVAIMLREARALWQITMGETPALPPYVIASKKMLAKQIGVAGIAKMWELALQTDKGIKSGELIPEQAFESLAAQLFQLFTPQQSYR